MCVCLVTRSCPTFCNPLDCCPLVPLSIGFFRQEYWSELSLLTPGDLPYPGIKPISPASPALQADSLPTETSSRLLLHYIPYHIIIFAYYYTFHLMLHMIIKWDNKIKWKNGSGQLYPLRLRTFKIRSEESPLVDAKGLVRLRQLSHDLLCVPARG